MALSTKHKISLFAFGLGAFVLFLVAGLQSDEFGPQTQPTVRHFPMLEVEQLSSNPTSTASLFTERYQLVNVWASWCGICRSEHEFLHTLESRGVPIIGLNYRDTRFAANNYLGELGNPYQQTLFDPKGMLSIDLGVVGTPETYLVTHDGKIVYKHLGVLNEKVWQRYFAKYFVQQGNSNA